MDSEDLGGQTPPMDDDERREMVLDRRQMLKRAGLGAAALAVPASVMATPAMGAVADALAADASSSRTRSGSSFRQPRDDEPVLRADDLRRAGRVLAARHAATSGRDRTTSDISQMVNAMNAAITAKADGIAVCLVSLTAFNGPTNRALGPGHPGAQLQRRRPERAARVHRPGSLPVRLQHGPADRRPRRQRRRRALHRDAGPAQHPASHRRRHCRDQEVRQGQDQDHDDRDRRAPSRRAGEDRRLLPGAQEPQGDVRGRLRLDGGRRQGHAEVRPRRRRASRPEATTSGRPSSRRSKPATWTSRSTSSPTCRAGFPSCSSSSTSTRRGSLRRRTRTPGILFVTKANVKPYLTTKTRYHGSSKKQKYPVTQPG